MSLLLEKELQELPLDEDGQVYWQNLAALFFGNREVTGKSNGSAGNAGNARDTPRYELTVDDATMDIYLQPLLVNGKP